MSKRIFIGSGDSSPVEIGVDGKTLLLLYPDGTIVGANGATLSGVAGVTTASVDVVAKNVRLTSAQVKNLASTSIEIVPAQGAGTVILVHSYAMRLNYGGSNAFTGVAGTTIDLEYVGGGFSPFDQCPYTNWNKTTSYMWQASPTITPMFAENLSSVANKAIQVTNTGTQAGGNAADDNTIDICVTYSVIPATVT